MPVVAPTAFRFANYLACSANADILLFYFGWVLRLPLGGWVLRLPFMPRLANFLVKWLPRWPVRGRTAYLYEDWEGCDVAGYTTEAAASERAAAVCGATRTARSASDARDGEPDQARLERSGRRGENFGRNDGRGDGARNVTKVDINSGLIARDAPPWREGEAGQSINFLLCLSSLHTHQ